MPVHICNATWFGTTSNALAQCRSVTSKGQGQVNVAYSRWPPSHALGCLGSESAEDTDEVKITLMPCKHVYCATCLQDYVKVKLADNVTLITCPVSVSTVIMTCFRLMWPFRVLAVPVNSIQWPFRPFRVLDVPVTCPRDLFDFSDCWLYQYNCPNDLSNLLKWWL